MCSLQCAQENFLGTHGPQACSQNSVDIANVSYSILKVAVICINNLQLQSDVLAAGEPWKVNILLFLDIELEDDGPCGSLSGLWPLQNELGLMMQCKIAQMTDRIWATAFILSDFQIFQCSGGQDYNKV